MHWLSAAIVVILLALGLYMTPWDETNPEFADNLYYWHKSFGVLFYIIIMVRLFMRRKDKLQPLPEGISPLEKFVARLAHRLLYILMVALPLLGYVQSSSYEYSTGVHFFFVDLPELLPKNDHVFEISNALHRWASYLLMAIISLHILGALKHRFFDKKNDVLHRIL
jgi:cytochrome b561